MSGFPVDAQGNTIPVLSPVYGQSKEVAVTTSTGAEMSINNTGGACAVRVWGLGCDCYYKSGVTGMTVPSVVDGLVLSNTWMEIPMGPNETHVRMVAKSGTGFGRVELLA